MMEDTRDTWNWDLASLGGLLLSLRTHSAVLGSPVGNHEGRKLMYPMVVVMEQVEPEMIIMSTRGQDSLIDKIEEFCE